MVTLSPPVTSSPVGSSDYRDIDPVVGSLADPEALLVRADALGLRVVIELVPDLSRSDSSVRAEFEQVLRFWLDRGVDGFQADVVHGLVKDPDQPSAAVSPRGCRPSPGDPYWDEEGVHDLYRSWRLRRRLHRRRPEPPADPVRLGRRVRRPGGPLRTARRAAPDRQHRIPVDPVGAGGAAPGDRGLAGRVRRCRRPAN